MSKMRDKDMYEVEIDLGELPYYVGRSNGGDIDYRYSDRTAVEFEINKMFNNHTNICATITGVMPTWLAKDLTVGMYEHPAVEQYQYITPRMIDKGVDPHVVFPRKVC